MYEKCMYVYMYKKNVCMLEKMYVCMYVWKKYMYVCM